MGRTRIVEAFIPFEASADGVATEFRLLKAGVNTYNDGDTIVFDDEAAKATLKRYTARGIDLMADYEHQSLVRPPIEAPASAKKWTPEVRDGALYASDIQWTEKAKGYLTAGEYRYFSIACRVDVKTNRCIELINFALTNLPAADGIAALVAASRNYTDENEEENMKTVIVALGLNADADEAAAVAKASRLADLERDIIALTKAAGVSEAMGVLRAYAQAHEQVIALTGEVAGLKQSQRAVEFDALVKAGQDANQITPAMASGEWLKAMRCREDGVAQLKSFLATAPKLAAKSADIVESPETNPAVELTAEEIKVASRFVAPGDTAALQKRLDALRAQKAADAKRG